jgi:hypothetical protein
MQSASSKVTPSIQRWSWVKTMMHKCQSQLTHCGEKRWLFDHLVGESGRYSPLAGSHQLAAGALIRSPRQRGRGRISGIVSPIAFAALMFQELYPNSARAHLASRSLLAREVIKERARPNLIDCGFLRKRSSSRQSPASASPSYSPPCGFPRCLCPVGSPILRCNFGRISGASASAT